MGVVVGAEARYNIILAGRYHWYKACERDKFVLPPFPHSCENPIHATEFQA